MEVKAFLTRLWVLNSYIPFMPMDKKEEVQAFGPLEIARIFRKAGPSSWQIEDGTLRGRVVGKVERMVTKKNKRSVKEKDGYRHIDTNHCAKYFSDDDSMNYMKETKDGVTKQTVKWRKINGIYVDINKKRRVVGSSMTQQ